MNIDEIIDNIDSNNLNIAFGRVVNISAVTLTAVGLDVAVGDIVRIESVQKLYTVLGMVTVLNDDMFVIVPFSFIDGFKINDKVFLQRDGLTIKCGNGLLGRVVNAIDSMLTCGKSQKVGIFAGSGVGKSTLMGMIVQGCEATIKVIALVGERGREIPEFIHYNLNNNLENTVIVTATSDESPLMRKYAAFTAMSIAEYFRDKGHDVLLMMESVTRFAMAQREIGLR